MLPRVLIKEFLARTRINVVVAQRHIRCFSYNTNLINDDTHSNYMKNDLFQNKTAKELLRSLLILKVSSWDFLVNHCEKIFLLGNRLIWRPMFERMMNSTFYGQFSAGESIEIAKVTAANLKKSNIRSMLCVPIEAPKHEIDQSIMEEAYERNFEIIRDCINGTDSIGDNGFSQLKISALCEKNLLLEMNKHLINHELNHQENNGWDIKILADNLAMGAFQNIDDLSEKCNDQLRKVIFRLDRLSQYAHERNVRLMIDAEQTYVQAAINHLVLVLQARYNKQTHLIHNTYQCYRKDTLQRIKADQDLAKKVGFHIAGKLVRGGYMSEERKLASEAQIPDPINDTYDDTTALYHSIVTYLMPYVVKKQIKVMIASHNEETIEFVKNCMKDKGLKKDSDYLSFGQILGMCDHVSYHLANEGYNTFKSVPYGNISDTMLYLSRRAHENRSVLQRTAFERLLIRKELKRRLALF